MYDVYLTVLLRLLAAVAAGGLIGLERSFHGRAAGFRTHTLVCTSAALLMQLTVYQLELLPNFPLETIRTDPTRMAQGIMTGIGFLGAGAIMREGLTVLGLTTAASIWFTAAIGILAGVGFYWAAGVATLLAFGTLGIFRWIEAVMPTLSYARLQVRFDRAQAPTEKELMDVIRAHSLEKTDINYRQEGERRYFTYEITMRTRDRRNYRRLAEHLSNWERVLEFDIRAAGA